MNFLRLSASSIEKYILLPANKKPQFTSFVIAYSLLFYMQFLFYLFLSEHSMGSLKTKMRV